MIRICENYKNLCFLCVFCFFSFIISSSTVYAQNNRLTNENGQLLWQYKQSASQSGTNSDTLVVTFVFTNGLYQTAISLRQELFYSVITWLDTADIQIEKEGRVESLTANLAPNQSVVWVYAIKNKTVGKELLLEKSALLIMNEEFEVRKEIIPEQKFAKDKL